MTPKILFVISGLDAPGGLEKIVTSLANALEKRGYHISVLTTTNNCRSFFPLSPSIPVTGVQLDFGMTKEIGYISRKIKFIRDIRLLKKQIDKIRPSLIISTEYVLHAALFANKIYKKYPVILWQHYVHSLKPGFMWRFLLHKMFHSAKAIIAVNPDEKSYYLRYNSNTLLIPNFTSPALNTSNADAKQILTVAQLSHHKGIDLLISMAKNILDENPSWQWKLIGEGVMEQQVSALAKHQPRFTWEKPASFAIDKEYLSSSVFVMTSRMEVFGLSLLEAKKFGMACVAFDCENGPRYLINDNIDGYLISPGNITEMETKINKIVNDDQTRKRMGMKAFENAKEFYEERVIPAWVDTIQSNLAT